MKLKEETTSSFRPFKSFVLFLILFVSDIESIVGDTGPGNSYADVAR